jgi:hypothetical protein
MVTANRRVEELDRAEASVAIMPGDAPIQRNVVTLDQALPFVSGRHVQRSRQRRYPRVDRVSPAAWAAGS